MERQAEPSSFPDGTASTFRNSESAPRPLTHDSADLHQIDQIVNVSLRLPLAEGVNAFPRCFSVRKSNHPGSPSPDDGRYSQKWRLGRLGPLHAPGRNAEAFDQGFGGLDVVQLCLNGAKLLNMLVRPIICERGFGNLQFVM